MDTTARSYERLIERFVAWAQTQPDIRAAIVLGSRARADRPADEWSDLDLVMLVTDPALFLASAEWLRSIGDVWLTFVEPTATGGGMERRALFEGDLDVDFSFAPCAGLERMFEHGVPPDVASVFRRGSRVLFDKDGHATRINTLPMPAAPTPMPTQAEFDEVAHDFLYHAVWAAKKLRRGELWTAKMCSDNYMKWRLLRMAEWHARAVHGSDWDVWHSGRFLEQWSDEHLLTGLTTAFAYYDADDLRRGLLATMEVFREIAIDTAARLGLSYPVLADAHVSALVRGLIGKTPSG
jgi:aminoglycoside 6-adenylyltransferase